MPFVFVSHAQRDKLRPDFRLRDLVRFLLARGVPLWIDKPEEIGIEREEIRRQALRLDGRWNDDIRIALRDCAVGIGIWSTHAADRIDRDPNGVLFQELNQLAISGRLFLVNLDAEAMARLDLAFRHLSGFQQCVDLSVDDRALFKLRLRGLVEDLARATGVYHFADASCVELFMAHAPGPRVPRLAPALNSALERQIESCRARNLPLRTFHRLLATFQTPSRFVQRCFDAAQPGLGEKTEKWLIQQVSEQDRREQPGYVPIHFTRDSLFDAASEICAQEGVSEIDERAYFLAIATQTDAGTIRALRSALLPGMFQTVIERARAQRPSITVAGTGPLSPFGD
jgi:hypothetical protein